MNHHHRVLVTALLLLQVSLAFSPPPLDEYNLSDYLKFIEHYGPKAQRFLTCMGLRFEEYCGPEVMLCFDQKKVQDPLVCIEQINCQGKRGVDCVHLLEDSTLVTGSSATTTFASTTSTTNRKTHPTTPPSIVATTTGRGNRHQTSTESTDFAKFVKLILRYGPKSIKFLDCMGLEFEEHCGTVTVKCLEGDDAKDPLACIRRLECRGKKGSDCVDRLEDTTAAPATKSTGNT